MSDTRQPRRRSIRVTFSEEQAEALLAPPAYTEHIGRQLLAYLELEVEEAA